MYKQIKNFLGGIAGLEFLHSYISNKGIHYFHFNATPNALRKICGFSNRTNLTVEVYLNGENQISYMLIVNPSQLHVLEDVRSLERAKSLGL
jgi:hypothetical protein